MSLHCDLAVLGQNISQDRDDIWTPLATDWTSWSGARDTIRRPPEKKFLNHAMHIYFFFTKEIHIVNYVSARLEEKEKNNMSSLMWTMSGCSWVALCEPSVMRRSETCWLWDRGEGVEDEQAPPHPWCGLERSFSRWRSGVGGRGNGEPIRLFLFWGWGGDESVWLGTETQRLRIAQTTPDTK